MHVHYFNIEDIDIYIYINTIKYIDRNSLHIIRTLMKHLIILYNFNNNNNNNNNNYNNNNNNNKNTTAVLYFLLHTFTSKFYKKLQMFGANYDLRLYS